MHMENITNSPLLEVRDLSVEYHTDMETVYAVNHVSFSLEKGKTLGLVGETGAGKTTTALALLRLLPERTGRVPNGEIIFEGRDLMGIKEGEMQLVRGGKISMIFQDPMTALNPVLTVGAQIREALELHNTTGASTKELEARVEETLELVGIPKERKDEYPHQFSGGMRQRVVIAIALACHPELIIADEPTTALDVTVQAQILSLLKDLQAEMGSSSILITHDLGVIAQSCDSVVVMYAGRVVEKAPVRELFANPRHAYTKGLLASIPQLSSMRKTKLPTIPGQVASIADFVPGCRFCQRQGVPAEELTERPPLVEISPDHFVEACPRCANL